MGIMGNQQQSVEQLFGAALDYCPEERRAFLDRACINAPELRRRVEELLLEDERAGSFLARPILVCPPNGPGIASPAFENSNRDPSYGSSDSARSGRFRPGETIASRFTVIRFIARGGMGEVYEVEDRFLQGVHVALKIILPWLATDDASSRRFEQEVLLARKLNHPSLCPIYDIARCSEPLPPFLFLTMKLLSGETLASRLGRPPLIPQGEAVAIFHQMASGLAAIHTAGIIHRDIKTNNVMLDYSGNELCLSIMDFGLARLHESHTTALTRGMIIGTPGYIAPELLHGQIPTEETDIFALGVLLQKVLIGDHPDSNVGGLSTKVSPALDQADVPAGFIQSVKEFLCEDPRRRSVAFQKVQSALGSGRAIAIQTFADEAQSRFSRRSFAIGSALTVGAAAGGIAWNWDSFDDLLHPIPRKRFVALLNWPPISNSTIRPMLDGVIDAISSKLSRAEAFDHNLFVTSHDEDPQIRTPAELNEVRDSLGANLVLATSGVAQSGRLLVFLRLLNASSTRILREKQISSPMSDQISLPGKAVHAAERLLNVSDFTRGRSRTKDETESADAYAAFQAAESFRKQENGSGLDASIEKYKEAIELDPHYALAHAQLSFAYRRLYDVHRDSAAIDLARGNAETALRLEPDLIEGHLALGSVLEATGDETAALREIATALSIDPSNPRTLIYQGQVYARLNKWREAESIFRRVLQERPNYWLPYNELGFTLYSQGNYPAALDAFRAASLAAPKNAMALNNVGSLYQLLGNFPQAEDVLNKSLALQPSGWAASATMADVLRSEGKYTEALAFALKAVTLKPAEPDNWLRLGDCYLALRGHSSESKAAYLRAAQLQETQLQTDPTDGNGWMRLALYRAKSGSLDDVPLLMKKAELFHVGDIDSQLTKARILELLGDREAALETIAACVKQGATNSQIQSIPDLESLRS
jgi:serine/threonine protein kinase/Flp pilus assembly protein TadD